LGRDVLDQVPRHSPNTNLGAFSDQKLRFLVGKSESPRPPLGSDSSPLAPLVHLLVYDYSGRIATLSVNQPGDSKLTGGPPAGDKSAQCTPYERSFRLTMTTSCSRIPPMATGSAMQNASGQEEPGLGV
jgi:hypothetical protein